MQIFSNIFVLTIAFACILGIAAFAALFSEKVGIINIAVNGGMIFGGMFYGLFAQIFNSSVNWTQLGLFLVAGIGGIIYALLLGFLVIKLKANQIIAGIALNLFAAGIAFIVLQSVGVSNRFNISTPELALNPNISTGNWENILSLKFVLLIAVIVISWFLLTKTKWGLRFRSIGENPQAAAVVGINVNIYKWQGILISGVLSALAGAIFVTYVNADFAGNVRGLGFLGLAILIIGQWNPILITISTVGFSLMYATGISLGTSVQDNLVKLKPFQDLLLILPYAITIIVLTTTSRNPKAPKSLEITYDKSLR